MLKSLLIPSIALIALWATIGAFDPGPMGMLIRLAFTGDI